jgi:hypothetical protein
MPTPGSQRRLAQHVMGIPFALSIHHFVNSVGADAGFASIIGLAILVFLFFAQMRETSTLRDQATESSERVRQLEGRLTQLHRAQAAAAQQASQAAAQAGQVAQPGQPLRQAPVPARAPAGAPAATAPPGVAAPSAGQTAVSPAPRMAAVAAPAGVGAPALTAATKLIPTETPGGGVALEAPPGRVGTVSDPAPVPFDVDAASPRPATAAGGANGAPAAGPGAPPRVQIRPGAAPPANRRPAPPQRGFEPPEEPPRSFARPLVYGIAGLVVVAAIVVILISLTGNGSSPSSSTQAKTTNAPTTTTKSKKHAGTVTVDPAKVTVAVLNGTATYHLADDISGRLVAIGFKKGAVTNAADQTHASTIVQYLPGSANKVDARAVAKALGLSDSAVSPIDAGTRALACVAATPCPPTEVVVTIGTDLAGNATSNGAGATTTGASGTVPVTTGTTGSATTGTTP